jgi:hypothetical protein
MTTGPQNPYGEPEPGTPPTHQPYGASPPPYDGGQQPPYWSGYPQQPYGYRPPAPKHPSSVTAMVLGIIGLVGIVSCLGVTLVLSPFAWAIGSKAVKEIDAAPPGTYTGRDEANSGRIMGIIGTVLLILAVLIVIVLMVLLVAVGGSTSETGY